MKGEKELAIYQTDEGAIQLRADFDMDTILATQKQISDIFSVDIRTVNEHIKNIFTQEELHEDNSVIRKFRITASDGKKYNTNHYSLDMIISVGYRVNSKTATDFRKWATKTLKQHITKGYTINKSILKRKEDLYKKVLNDIQELSQNSASIPQSNIIELIKNFSHTWFSLESFDEDNLPQKGQTQAEIKLTAADLYNDVNVLKNELIKKGEATELFAQEKIVGALEGIFGNVLQRFDGKDVYGSLEEKAAHLLYFIVKNHAFNDGNKRTGAFTFIWFLKKNNIENHERITPETLTTLTILIAQSDPKDKERIVGLILLLFR